MKLREKMEEYLESQSFKALSNNSKRSYKIATVFLLRCYGPNMEVAEIPGKLDRFVKFCEQRDMRGQTLRYRLTCVKLILAWALSKEVRYSYRVPREDIQAKKLRALKRWFSENEIEKCLGYKFLWAMDDAPIYRIMVHMFIETGMRLSELLAVTWGDVNLQERMLTVAFSKTEPRPAFFSPETAEMLEQWRNHRTVKPQEEDRVFPSDKKVNTAIQQMLFDLGIKEEGDHRAAHTFRHWTATKLFYDGNMRIEDVAFLLGDEPSTIIQNYLHPTPRMLRQRVDAAMGWAVEEPPRKEGEKTLILPQNLKDAQGALAVLGYGKKEINDMLGNMTYVPEMTAEDIVQAALRRPD